MDLHLDTLFSSVFEWLNTVVDWMDDLILFGSFSLLDFLIVLAIGNIVISALVITFNYRGSRRETSSSGASSRRSD